MHPSWSEDVAGRNILAKVTKCQCESLVADAVHAIAEQDAAHVIEMCNGIQRAVDDTELGTIKSYLMNLEEGQLANIVGWAYVGSQYGFMRCLEAAVMNDELKEA